MKKNNISAILTCYNREPFIEKAILSIINQKKISEIIVVDDGSTDNTVEIIRGMDSDLIKLFISEKNLGAQTARNRGISEAKGEWIAFCDSDDEWLPDKLERQIMELEKVDFNPMTVVHGNTIVRKGINKRIWKIPETHGVNVMPLMLKRPAPFFQAMLVSKIALEKIGMLDENVPAYQEWETAIRLSEICSFVHISAPLFIYNIHDGDMISKNDKNSIEGYHYIIKKHRDKIIKICGINTWYLHNFKLFILCEQKNISVPQEVMSVVVKRKYLYYAASFLGKLKKRQKLLRWLENIVRLLCR
ncbi:MAG TPA: glycosyltransferase family 2 protein [bacterium]|nr:glycosyltransferase family 2 protein [bacterium]